MQWKLKGKQNLSPWLPQDQSGPLTILTPGANILPGRPQTITLRDQHHPASENSRQTSKSVFVGAGHFFSATEPHCDNCGRHFDFSGPNGGESLFYSLFAHFRRPHAFNSEIRGKRRAINTGERYVRVYCCHSSDVLSKRSVLFGISFAGCCGHWDFWWSGAGYLKYKTYVCFYCLPSFHSLFLRKILFCLFSTARLEFWFWDRENNWNTNKNSFYLKNNVWSSNIPRWKK